MANGTLTYGIDVSHFNGDIDWDATVKDPNTPKINFCYAKASQLHKFSDPSQPPQCPDAYFPVVTFRHGPTRACTREGCSITRLPFYA
jgi:hypothetical protein